MSASLLITTIISYILSLVISLALMIFSRRIDDRWKKGVVILQTVILFIYLLSLIFLKTNSGIAFIIFFCSGLAIAGMVLRSGLNVILKIYYSVFLFSIVIFIYSPSVLFSLVAQQKFPDKKRTEFFLTGNYFLIKEKSMLEVSNEFARYKIVKRTGQFNKTMQRNISFKYEIDSVKVLKFIEEKEASLRAYFKNKNNSFDSTDVTAALKMEQENDITIHRK